METPGLTITEAQQDVRRAFVGGGPDAIVSGVIWLIAAFLIKQSGLGPAFAYLFFGGMLIFPLAQLALRFLFRRSPVSKDNPLGRGLAGKYPRHDWRSSCSLALPIRQTGVRLSDCGDALFWLLGALLTAVGTMDILGYARLPGGTILAVGLIEIFSGIVFSARAKRRWGGRELPVFGGDRAVGGFGGEIERERGGS